MEIAKGDYRKLVFSVESFQFSKFYENDAKSDNHTLICLTSEEITPKSTVINTISSPFSWHNLES